MDKTFHCGHTECCLRIPASVMEHKPAYKELAGFSFENFTKSLCNLHILPRTGRLSVRTNNNAVLHFSVSRWKEGRLFFLEDVTVL